MLQSIARNPHAAKRALETWMRQDDAKLRALAEACRETPKAKALATRALSYLELRARHPSFPSFSEWGELTRLGITLDFDAPAVALRLTPVECTPWTTPLPDSWHLRARWPTEPHPFWIKSKKDATQITFAPDRSRDVEVEAHRGPTGVAAWHLRLVHLADADDGWAYFGEIDRGGFYRRRGADTQVMAGPFLSWVR